MVCRQTLINTARIDYEFHGLELSASTSAAFERRNFMPCKPVCKLCEKLILSQSVSFSNGVLTVNLPAGSYDNGCKYCVVVAQAIPANTTISAPVVFTIGSNTRTYPLVKQDCAPVTACGIRSRTKYSVMVSTGVSGGVFKMMGKPCCSPDNALPSLIGSDQV